MDILNVTEKVEFDNSIVRAQVHNHYPYTTNAFANSDEVRIPIQQLDVFTLPSHSCIYLEGKLLRADGKISATAKMTNNGFAHLFEEIRFEMGGKVIDQVRNPGVATTLKSLVSFNKNEMELAAMAGFKLNVYDGMDKTTGFFNVCIPLKYLLGFAEDYGKVLMNIHQELILLRSHSDLNAIYSSDPAETLKVTISKIVWRVPHITANDVERLSLLGHIANRRELDVAFRSWSLNEYPLLPKTREHTWAIKSSSQLEKPRYAILAFHTDRKNQQNKNMTLFDHCNLTNVKLYLNSEQFPYESINANFKNKQFIILYEMYTKFQASYYNRSSEPLLTPEQFLNEHTIIVIDCSRQSEVLNTGAVDIRLEFETSDDIPDKTSLYCLLLHDRILKYTPQTGAVRTL